MPKLNNNPFAVAEAGIAAYLAEVPEISALFSGTKVPVYYSLQESAEASIMQELDAGLGQCVVVSFSGVESVVRLRDKTVAESAITIDIISSGLLAENALRSTSDLGYAIICALDFVRFSGPLDTHPLVFEKWSHSADASGAFRATLEFSANITIR